MRIVITPRLALALPAPISAAPALRRPLWAALLTAPNGGPSRESRALR